MVYSNVIDISSSVFLCILRYTKLLFCCFRLMFDGYVESDDLFIYDYHHPSVSKSSCKQCTASIIVYCKNKLDKSAFVFGLI